MIKVTLKMKGNVGMVMAKVIETKYLSHFSVHISAYN